MGKTPEYTKKAINNYRDKFDFIQIRFPKGTKERLQSADVGNINDYVVKCVLDKLLANPEYAATYAQLMAMETAEKEKKRAEMLTRARLETL